MDDRGKVDQIVRELGGIIGIPELCLDDGGFGSLTFDGKITVNMLYNPNNNHLIIYSEIGMVPPDSREAVYRHLLLGNRFWQGTDGGTLSVDDEDRGVYALQIACDTLDTNALKTILERCADIAEEWMDFIEGYTSQAESSEPPVHYDGRGGIPPNIVMA